MNDWILVSERLPERTGEYLVSVIDGSGDDNDYEATGVAWFAHKKDYNIKESEWRELQIDETVIAWMPLPKPYERTDSHHKKQKATDIVKAVIPVEVPKYQIGQEVSVYFKDTMYIKGICQETDE